jgi:hypothetical protein
MDHFSSLDFLVQPVMVQWLGTGREDGVWSSRMGEDAHLRLPFPVPSLAAFFLLPPSSYPQDTLFSTVFSCGMSVRVLRFRDFAKRLLPLFPSPSRSLAQFLLLSKSCVRETLLIDYNLSAQLCSLSLSLSLSLSQSLNLSIAPYVLSVLFFRVNTHTFSHTSCFDGIKKEAR